MNIKIDFLEYIIMAILISILYTFTAIEILIKKNKNPKENIEEHQFSAQWALLGIILTVICGYIVKWGILKGIIDYNIYLLLIPLFFIGQWLFFYIENSIVINKLSNIKGQVLEAYKPILVQTLSEIKDGNYICTNNHKIYFIDDDCYANREVILYLVNQKLKNDQSQAFENLIAGLLNKVGKIGKKNIKNKGLDIVFDIAIFDEQKLNILLSKLKNKEEIDVKTHIRYKLLYKIKNTSLDK